MSLPGKVSAFARQDNANVCKGRANGFARQVRLKGKVKEGKASAFASLCKAKQVPFQGQIRTRLVPLLSKSRQMVLQGKGHCLCT
jgi:hypothetical protein